MSTTEDSYTEIERLAKAIIGEISVLRGVKPTEPAKLAEPPAKPSTPVVDINSARNTVDTLVQTGAFGPSPGSKKFLQAVNDMQGALRVYHEEDDPSSPAKNRHKEEIKQELVEMRRLSLQTEGMARMYFVAYIDAAERELENPAKHEGAPNLTEGDLEEVGKDMTN